MTNRSGIARRLSGSLGFFWWRRSRRRRLPRLCLPCFLERCSGSSVLKAYFAAMEHAAAMFGKTGLRSTHLSTVYTVQPYSPLEEP